jgi:hypothetical protein
MLAADRIGFDEIPTGLFLEFLGSVVISTVPQKENLTMYSTVTMRRAQ